MFSIFLILSKVRTFLSIKKITILSYIKVYTNSQLSRVALGILIIMVGSLALGIHFMSIGIHLVIHQTVDDQLGQYHDQQNQHKLRHNLDLFLQSTNLGISRDLQRSYVWVFTWKALEHRLHRWNIVRLELSLSLAQPRAPELVHAFLLLWLLHLFQNRLYLSKPKLHT